METMICRNPKCRAVISFERDGMPNQVVLCPVCPRYNRVPQPANAVAPSSALPVSKPSVPVPPIPVAQIAPPEVDVEVVEEEPSAELPVRKKKPKDRFMQSWLATWLGLRLIFIGAKITVYLRAIFILAYFGLLVAGFIILIMNSGERQHAQLRPAPPPEAEIVLMIIITIIVLIAAGWCLLALVADGLVNLGYLLLVFTPSRSGARLLGTPLALTAALYGLVALGIGYVVVVQVQRGNPSLRMVEQIANLASLAFGFVGFIQRMLLWSFIYRMGIGLKAHRLSDGAYDLFIGFLWLIACVFLLICPPIGLVVVMWYGFRLQFDELSLIADAAHVAGRLSRS